MEEERMGTRICPRQRRRSSQAQSFDEQEAMEPRSLFRNNILRDLSNVRPLYVFERALRAALVVIPELMNKSFPFINRISTLVFCYVFFQVMGLLWAFLCCMALALSIEASAWGTSLLALVWYNDETDMAEDDTTIIKAFSTFYVVYVTFRVFAGFGSAVGFTAWESLDDFPQVRITAVNAVRRWPHCLLLVFFPILFITMILMTTPSMCSPTCSLEAEWKDTFDFLNASRWVCCRTPVLYLTTAYPKVRRAIKLALTLGIVQYLQLLLHHYPNWRPELLRCSRWVRLSLNSLLTFCLCLTSWWTITWVASKFVGNFPENAILRVDTDMWLISAWVTFLLALTIVLSMSTASNAFPATGLRALVQNLKNTFNAACGMFFIISCFDPDVGFLDAQAELTILTIIIPIFYTLAYLSMKMASNISIKLLFYGVPVAIFLAVIICRISITGDLGTMLLVTLHIYRKFVLLFGHQELLKDGTPEYGLVKPQRKVHPIDGGGIRKDGGLSLQSEGDMTTTTEKPHNITIHGELVPEPSSPQSKECNRRKEWGTRRAISTGCIISPEEHRRVLTPNVSSITRSINTSARSLMNNIVEVLPSSREGRRTNSVFVYKGVVNLMISALVISGFFITLFQILSHTQENRQWYTHVVTLEHSRDQATISVNNAHVSRMVLHLNEKTSSSSDEASSSGKSTTTAMPLHPPHYAVCDSLWYGLSLVDYALISEIVYLGHVTDKVPMIKALQHFFPPEIMPNGSRFDLHVPGEEFSSKSQFVEIVDESTNLSIIAIRGTDIFRLSDFVEDIRMWVEPMVFAILSWIFPTIRIWPASTTSLVIEWLHEMLGLFGLRLGHSPDYYLPIVNYVKKVKKSGRNVVVTGHSLGGGLARIISSQELVTSVCFSPPGIAQSYKKFHLTESQAGSLHHASISVLPEFDFVSLIDTQVGMVQRISCRNHGKALQNACHMLEGTICELINHCGDARGRFSSCEFSYGFGNVFNIIWLRIWENAHWNAYYFIPFFISTALVVLMFLFRNVL